MLEATAHLVARRGFHGTSLTDILEASGAPRGSLYHHFPGGKDELVLEATRLGVTWADEAFERAFGGGVPAAEAVRVFFDDLAAYVREHRYHVGCPVAPLVLDGLPGSPELQDLCTDALARWKRTFAAAFEADGLAPNRAERLATLVLAAEEGALLLALAERSDAAVVETGDELARIVRAAVQG